MSTIPRVADSMCHILTVAANEAAKRSSFVKRRRKLDGASFVQALVFGWMANPEATAEERAQVAASRGVPISAYDGLDKRCDERGADCLRRVLTAAVVQAVACAEPAAVPILGRLEGVYVYDGSVVSLPEELREEWPGLGGNRPGAGVAAPKIGVRLELLGGELYGPVLGAGREHDRTLPLGAEALPAGALRLADLGFFDLELFRLLDEEGGYWLSRRRGWHSGSRRGCARRRSSGPLGPPWRAAAGGDAGTAGAFGGPSATARQAPGYARAPSGGRRAAPEATRRRAQAPTSAERHPACLGRLDDPGHQNAPPELLEAREAFSS